jgi:hypothetical protein
MVPTNSTVSFMEKEFHHQNQYNEVEDLINNYIDTEPELKQRIYKCQYALIKAGYKGNAKW